MLATKSNSKTIFYDRSRVKDPGSILEKLFDRQLRYGDRYSIKSITDIVGYRLVVLYDDQLRAAFKLAVQVLRNCHYSEDSLVTDPDLWKNIHEIKFFPRSQNDDDPYTVMYRDLCSDPTVIGPASGDWEAKVKRADPVGAPGSKSAYSSMHIIVYVASYSTGQPKLVPLELQIRTAVEDIWSEISHENEYKVRKRNAWSPDLKQRYEENYLETKFLKEQLNTVVPYHVAKIRRNTDFIIRELAKLRSSPIAQFNSYVLNLAFHIAVTSLDNSGRERFDEYSACIERIRPVYAKRRDPSRMTDLLKEFEEAKARLSEVSKIEFSDADCQSSFDGLIRLEQARLEAIEIRVLLTSSTLSEEVKRTTIARADRLYSVLDEIQSDEALRLKPIAMIEYFKYYVFRFSSYKNSLLVRDHLNACYSALKIDPTVNHDGMMVVMATRALAQNYWESAEEYRSMLKDARNASVAREMRERYSDALMLALESRAAYERRDKVDIKRKVDDLIFGGSPFEEYTCSNNVIMYASDCILNGIGEEAFIELQYSVDDLQRDADELLAFLESGPHDNPDIWHTAMVGFGALAKSNHNANSNIERERRIADRILAELGTKIVHDRIRSDAQAVLGKLS